MSAESNTMKSRWIIVLLLGISFSCARVDADKIENLNGSKILAIGHAGMGFVSYMLPFNPNPPNSFASLQKALNSGADGIEVDIQMTKDSVLVLFHDLTLDSRTDLTGCIGQYTAKELQQAYYTEEPVMNRFQHEKIITLDSLLSGCATLKTYPHLQFDIKAYNFCDTLNPYRKTEVACAEIIRILNRHQVPKNRVVLISSLLKNINYFQARKAGYTLAYEETENFDRGMRRVGENGVKYLAIKAKLLTAANVKKAHSEDVRIITFGAKSRSGNAKLIRMNPDVIQSNNIVVLLDLLHSD